MSGDTLKFLTQALKSPESIGGIVPSSRKLAETMLAAVDFKTKTTIIEIGIGTGAITSVIAEKLLPHNHYVGIELNEDFYALMSARFPHMRFINGNAENLGSILGSLDIAHADVVICSLPWASLPETVQTRILKAVVQSMHPGAVFVTYAYLQGLLLPSAWTLRRLLKAQFSHVTTTRTVWRNIPPAFAYVCYR